VDEFLTVAEVAELLKLNPQTVRNWIFRPLAGVCLFTVGFRGRWVDLPSGGRRSLSVTR